MPGRTGRSPDVTDHKRTTRTRFHHAVVFPTSDAFDHPDVSRYHPARLHHHPLRAGRPGRAHVAAGAGITERDRPLQWQQGGAGALR
ncbi:hypothetical protein D3C79_808810 [compost metagenome]